MTTKLTLRSDRLHELTSDDLLAVVGGLPTQLGPETVFECPGYTGYYQTLPVYGCLTTG